MRMCLSCDHHMIIIIVIIIIILLQMLITFLGSVLLDMQMMTESEGFMLVP